MEFPVCAQIGPAPEIAPPAAAELVWARRMVIATVLFPMVLMLLIAADGLVRSVRQDRTAIAWMHRLELSAPALWPSGTAQRYPAALSPAVDLRMTPLDGFAGRGPLQPFPATPAGRNDHEP